MGLIQLKKESKQEKVAEVSPQYHHNKPYLKGEMLSEGQHIKRQNAQIWFKMELNVFEKWHVLCEQQGAL